MTTGRGDGGGWRIVEPVGPAQRLHDLDVAAGGGREVWVCRTTVPALVLGSTQSDDVVDEDALAARGIERVRRRSGGGAVLLDPLEVAAWVDVVLPRGDRLWSDDVGRASHWVGETWAAALDSIGVAAEVHRGPLVRRRWSDLVCFAGLGPGEVVTGGRKLVGLSQRRTRAGARFQTLVLRRWEPARLLELLSLEAADRVEMATEIKDAAEGVDVAVDQLVAAFVANLPRA